MAVASVYQFIGYVLSHTAAIVAHVSTRIFFGNIPEMITTKPVINYMVVDKIRLAVTDHYRIHFQITIRHIIPETLWTIAGLVIDAFDNYQGTADGFDVQCGYYDNSRMMSEPNNVYAVPLDIYITYKGV